jgi:hypothetical protein
LPSSPGSVTNPQVGAPYTPPSTPAEFDPNTLALQGGTDPSGRPMFPSLFITDITGLDPNSVAAHGGDWQYGGTPIAPSAVYGTWKGMTETIDETGSTPKIQFNVGQDPQQNHWNLGPGSDTPPSAVQNQGYGAEVDWNVNSLGLIPGHVYRFYVMVHDGDQNKSGGDVGQACVDLVFTGAGPITPPNNGNPAGVITKLNDSATLSQGNNPTGTVTFYLFAPGVTPNANLSNNVYADQVTVNGNGTYTTASGNNPGGYQATQAGTYEWVAVYSGDSNNKSASSPFGSEPQPVSPSQIAVPQLVKGTVNDTQISELLNPTGALKPGKITVAVNLPKGPHAAAEAAAIKQVLSHLNGQLKPMGISFVQVSGAQAANAQVHINMASTTSIGGMAQGVLGAYSLAPGGNITLVDGWKWYFGSDPKLIGKKQYDFESVVTHELGHVLGLGENTDSKSAMDLYFASGQVNRNLAAEDLAAIRAELARGK